MNTFKKTTLSLAISALAGGAMAQSAPAPAPAPEKSPITANVTVVNDYRYRGMTQSNYKPAIQGGFDYSHEESGFYIGNWNSSISWIGDTYSNANGSSTTVSAPIEMDFYAGFKKELIAPGFASDIGVLQYYYPNNGIKSTVACTSGSVRATCGLSPNTTEMYLAQNFTLGALTGFIKASYSLTNIFGIYNSKGSWYPDLTVNYDTGFEGITLNGHIGYQLVNNNATVSNTKYNYSYTDWKLGITKDFGGGLSANVSYVATTNPKVAGSYLWSTNTTQTQQSGSGKAGGLISLTKTF